MKVNHVCRFQVQNLTYNCQSAKCHRFTAAHHSKGSEASCQPGYHHYLLQSFQQVDDSCLLGGRGDLPCGPRVVSAPHVLVPHPQKRFAILERLEQGSQLGQEFVLCCVLQGSRKFELHMGYIPAGQPTGWSDSTPAYVACDVGHGEGGDGGCQRHCSANQAMFVLLQTNRQRTVPVTASAWGL